MFLEPPNPPGLSQALLVGGVVFSEAVNCGSLPHPAMDGAFGKARTPTVVGFNATSRWRTHGVLGATILGAPISHSPFIFSLLIPLLPFYSFT